MMSFNQVSRALRVHFSTQTKFSITGTICFSRKQVPSVGQYAEVVHIFSQPDVNTFAGICGDSNPIHINPEVAKDSMFGGTIVHGIFTSSLFSTIFGRALPGAIYVDQQLAFKRPVHVGIQVIARVEVLEVQERNKGHLVTCATVCKLQSDGRVAVDGKATVLLPYNNNC
jgi:3-hydroxybutyryl-CoA dehydratase